MKAMVLPGITKLANNSSPLKLEQLEQPIPEEGEVLIKITACAVCHTEIDEIEGRVLPTKLPIIPGHQVVGEVFKTTDHTEGVKVGDRVGVAWIFSACGSCEFCKEGNENLCKEFKATGKDVNGGYAEYMVAKSGFVYRIPDAYTDIEAAPLLCAGAIGYRSLKLTNLKNGQSLGLTGFGASAHLVLKLAKCLFPESDIYVFSRSENERKFALELGASWSGEIHDRSPEQLDAIIDTTPAWKPVLESLKNLKPGGRLVINAIRKENIDKEELLKMDYSEHLWLEKEIKSVANVTRADVKQFLEIVERIPIKPEVQVFALEDANKALIEIRQRNIKGAKVLKIA